MKNHDELQSSPYNVVDENGETVVFLNENLAKIQKVGPHALAALRSSHLLLRKIRNSVPENASSTELRFFAAVIDSVEKEQQRLWGFPDDPAKRRWNFVPGCSCPKIDPLSGMKVSPSDSCRVHGEAGDALASLEVGELSSISRTSDETRERRL